MGKETKIGLAVLGVLLTVFGVLLFRHLASSRAPKPFIEEAQAPAVPLSSEGMSDKPNVVTAQQDGALADSGTAPWATNELAANRADRVPPASYLPVETETPAELPVDPYAQGDERGYQRAAPLASATSPGANPFHDDMPERGRPAAQPQARLADARGADPSHTNPLRRVNAELPLNGPDGDAPAGAEDYPQTPADPYADPYANDPYADGPAEIPAQQDAPTDAFDAAEAEPEFIEPPADGGQDFPQYEPLPQGPGAEMPARYGRFARWSRARGLRQRGGAAAAGATAGRSGRRDQPIAGAE